MFASPVLLHEAMGAGDDQAHSWRNANVRRGGDPALTLPTFLTTHDVVLGAACRHDLMSVMP
jgi:hypothetical protein